MDVQKKIEQEIDDYFFNLQKDKNIQIKLDVIDELISQAVQTALKRSKKSLRARIRSPQTVG